MKLIRSKYFPFILPFILAFVLFLGFVGVTRLLDSAENKEEQVMYDGETVRLVMGSRLLSVSHVPIIRDGRIALDLSTVRRYIDNTVDWDENNGRVTVTTRDKVVRMNTENLTAYVNGDEEVRLDIPIFKENDIVYLPIEFLSEFFQIRVTYDETNNVVMIDDRRIVVQTARVVERDAVIRLGRSIKEPVVKRYRNVPQSSPLGDANGGMADGGETAADDVAANGENAADTGGSGANDAQGSASGDGSDGNGVDLNSLLDFESADFDMYVFEDYEGWYKVRSLDGIIGYIEKKYVAVSRFVDRVALNEQRPTPWVPDDGKIVMVWEQVNSAGSNPSASDMPEMPGLDIVSPTWFVLTDSGGTVESRASAEYIEWARSNGYKVWALFANTSNDIDMTSVFLNDSDSREKAIRSLLFYAEMLHIDGINLDFENIYLKDKDALTQFVRELAPMLREQGLVFSVDVNIPDGSDTWSRCYDTPAIAEIADYVNLMAYDQFGAHSNVAGSVSQRAWVEENLTKLIDRDGVPSEKIILGIPFYTRVWQMADGESAEKGGEIADSSALGMNTAINSVLDNGESVEWDTDSGQFFCIYRKNGNTYHVWLEEPESVNVRASLVHKYALAGVSAWSRNFVIPQIWDVLNRGLKEIDSYDQWLDEAYVEQPELSGNTP